jgi:hypothetical protein
MPAIVGFPAIVEEAIKEFGLVFNNEPERRHFAEYLTGLLIAERKTLSGINSEFAVRTDQSCLNRWITEVNWDEKLLNEKRLEWLQRDEATRYSAQVVIPIDNTLITHEGRLIEDVGWFWDHADKRHLIATFFCSLPLLTSLAQVCVRIRNRIMEASTVINFVTFCGPVFGQPSVLYV